MANRTTPNAAANQVLAPRPRGRPPAPKTVQVRFRLPDEIYDRWARYSIRTGEPVESILKRLAIHHAPVLPALGTPQAPVVSTPAPGRRVARSPYLR